MRTKLLYGTLSVSVLVLVSQLVFAAPPTSFYTPGETTDPTCSPGDTNCDVELASGDNIYTANGITGTGRTVGITDTLNFDSDTFVIDGVNNRVGIGALNPLEKLHVNSKMILGGDVSSELGILDLRDGTGRSSVAGFGGGLALSSSTDAHLNTHMYIQGGTGNVGIGNTTPTNQLQVGAGNDAVFVNNAGTTSRLLLGHPDLSVLSGRGGIAYDRTSGDMRIVSTDAGVLQNRIFIQGDGNIGIGTITPESKLSIVGLPSGTSGINAGMNGSSVGAICIMSDGDMYIDTDGVCN